MRKNISLLSILLLALICTSCATLPKTVKENDTLVIGRIKCSLAGYKNYEDVKINGLYTSGIEAKIIDTIDNKEYTINPDKDGYFYIKNLPPHHACAITYVKCTRGGASGNGYQVWIDIPANQRKIFIPYKQMVVNIGTNEFYFDGGRNWVTWEYLDHSNVNVHFKQLDVKSEWLDKKIYDQ